MSRKCPKRQHLFLNWLKENIDQFPFKPIITKVYKGHIYGRFSGITNAIGFNVLRGSGIHLDVTLSKRDFGFLDMFLVWEKSCKKGFYAEWLVSEQEQVCYPTRAELLVAECYEPLGL